MRIVFQGAATPAQIGKKVAEILADTLEKAEVKAAKYPLQNAVVEFNLNLQGYDKPMIIMDEEHGGMLAVHTGIEKGELVPYVEPDRTELLKKFDEMLDATSEAISDDEEKPLN